MLKNIRAEKSTIHHHPKEDGVSSSLPSMNGSQNDAENFLKGVFFYGQGKSIPDAGFKIEESMEETIAETTLNETPEDETLIPAEPFIAKPAGIKMTDYQHGYISDGKDTQYIAVSDDYKLAPGSLLSDTGTIGITKDGEEVAAFFQFKDFDSLKALFEKVKANDYDEYLINDTFME